MDICHVQRPDVAFVMTCYGWALEEVARQLGGKYVQFPFTQWQQQTETVRYDEPCIFVIEEGYLILRRGFHDAAPGWSNVSFDMLRERFPRGKIVILGGDLHYIRLGGAAVSLADLDGKPDLILEMLSSEAQHWRSCGYATEVLAWTGSERLFRMCEAIGKQPQRYDASCLIRPCTDWRRRFFAALKQRGLKIYRGKSKHTTVDELPEILHAMAACEVNIGTTSSSAFRMPMVRSMKGFRDWIGPLLGVPLIYDNHPDVAGKWPCPIYNYARDANIAARNVANMLHAMRDADTSAVVAGQQQWAWEHSLEKQFLHFFEKHGLLA